MSVLAAARKLLIDDQDFYDLVKNRVFLAHAKQTEKTPFVVYLPIDVDPLVSKETSNADEYIVSYLFFSKRYEEAKSIADKTRECFDFFKGTISSIPLEIYFQQENYRFEEKKKLHLIQHDYKIFNYK